jgi:predicted nucleic acid-binding protein
MEENELSVCSRNETERCWSGREDLNLPPGPEFLAQQTGDLMASRQKKGRPVELRDTMIAGIVLARYATLATRNTAHFEDISASVVNPWVG